MQINSQNKTLRFSFFCSKKFMIEVYTNRSYLISSAMLIVCLNMKDPGSIYLFKVNNGNIGEGVKYVQS